MPLGPYEMPDAQWELAMKLIKWKMQQAGLTTIEEGVLLIKRFWEIMKDPVQMQAIDDQNTLNQILAHRDRQDTNRADLDAQIAALEAALGL